MDITNKQFIVYLRSALHHIYYPDQLRRSPLIGIFGISDRVDAPSALQKILTDAIDALRPGAEEPPRSHSWVVYDALFFLYIRGYERETVADQLGISDRQFSREQRTAVETLAIYLWKNYHLEAQPVPPTENSLEISSMEEKSAPLEHNERGDRSERSEELLADTPASWKPVVFSVIDLIQHLAEKQGVKIVSQDFTGLLDLIIPKFTLRHSLLSLLEWVIPMTADGKLHLAADVQPDQLRLSIQALVQSDFTSERNLAEFPSLVATRQLLEKSAGEMSVLVEAKILTISLFLHPLEQIQVLVIDDNRDTLQLFQRYAEGSRYFITGLPDSNSFKLYVERIAPKIILLDVMMPEIDGWEVLAQLRQDFPENDAAIIVCSILPVESLARSLGANAFLQKPVLPRDFLNALDQQMEKFPPAID
jgi:CheY-like chemotaxis protein